jgi:ATP-dependent Lon protease
MTVKPPARPKSTSSGKDGPSAGTAITTTIYSLLNNKRIKKDIAITGEINLQGKVSAIGGLELKILGGIKAGVKTFIYPQENDKDYDKFVEKYKEKDVYDDTINFVSVTHISEVLNMVFV